MMTFWPLISSTLLDFSAVKSALSYTFCITLIAVRYSCTSFVSGDGSRGVSTELVDAGLSLLSGS